MVDAVGRAGLLPAVDEGHLVMFVGVLAEEDDFPVIPAERPPVGDLEPQHIGVERQHPLHILDIEHHMGPCERHRSTPAAIPPPFF